MQIAEFDRPMRSDDEETAQTVTYMDELAAADAGDRAVIAATAEALEQAGIEARSSTPLEKACAVYWWLKRTIRYVPTPGTSPLVDQTLITPCAVLAMPEPIGDCPQFSMLASAMFRVLCMNSFFVTIAAEPSFPDQWSHIYNTVEVGPGQYLPFDSSNGPSPGAEYAKPYKRRVWPRIAPGQCVSKEGSVQMMRSTTHHRKPQGMRNRALRGALGTVNCDQDGNCYDDGTGVYTPAPVTDTYSSTDSLTDQVNAINSLSDSVYGSSSSSPGTTINLNPASSNQANPLNTLITSAAQIAAPIVKAATTVAPYYITNPVTGQSVLYNPNTATTVGTLSSSLSSLSPTTLLVGIGLLAALMFAGKK